MDILEYELVKKYFGCENGNECIVYRHQHEETAMRVLRSMQKPIRKGDLVLCFPEFGSDSTEPAAWHCDYARFHPHLLRLPDKFQPAGKPKVCQHYVTCESCQSTVDLPQPSPSPKGCPDKLCNEAGYCRGHKPADSGKCGCGACSCKSGICYSWCPCDHSKPCLHESVEEKVIDLNSFFVACDPSKDYAREHFKKMISELVAVARKEPK